MILLLHGLGCSKESFREIWFRDEFNDHSILSFHKFEKEVLLEFKELSKSLGKGRFFLDSALPLGFYKSAESLVRWSDSGELLSRFKNLPCRKSYFYGEKNADTVALHRLNSIDKIMIGNSGHFMMNDSPDEFYPRLSRFLSST